MTQRCQENTNTTQRNATQHNTTHHNTTQHNTTQHNTTQHNTTQHNTTQHNTTQHNTTQHNTPQHTTPNHTRGYAHAKARATLLKARLGPSSTMAWVRLHQQAEREREYSRNFWADSSRLVGGLQVSPTPLFPPISTHLHKARALDTQPSRLPVPVARHPGHCLLVTAPSARHTTPHHTAPHPAARPRVAPRGGVAVY